MVAEVESDSCLIYLISGVYVVINVSEELVLFLCEAHR